ncbi:MAG: hypothetical protein KGL39_10100 [Patescibacteria group bacterium]|nr:hypothetical protein [Patescibacteria group bacterium]
MGEPCPHHSLQNQSKTISLAILQIHRKFPQMVAESSQVLPKLPTIRRKITIEDVEAIAEMMAKRITETGACLILGIKPESWFHFKQRAKNENKFAQLLTRAREAQLNSHLENIESFQVKDWRASHALLQLKAPDRFCQQQSPQSVNQTVINIGESAIRAILDKYPVKPSLADQNDSMII